MSQALPLFSMRLVIFNNKPLLFVSIPSLHKTSIFPVYPHPSSIHFATFTKWLFRESDEPVPLSRWSSADHWSATDSSPDFGRRQPGVGLFAD